MSAPYQYVTTMMVPEITTSSAIAGLISLIVLSVIWTVIQRLFFSPIANFPGPKLAAATWWYEIYYDVILPGRYWAKIQKLHEIYGPIIRVNPYELHISDPEFYDTVYASSASGLKRDKWEFSHKYLGIPDSSLLTMPHEHHRLRRAALSPFFSAASVRRLQPGLDKIVNRMMDRFRDYQDSGDVMIVNQAMAAFAHDAVTSYCFGQYSDLVSEPDFHPLTYDNIEGGLKVGPLLKHNFWMMQLLQSLPEWLSAWLVPPYGGFVEEKNGFGVQAKAIMEASRSSFKETEHPTIFHEILNSKLPPQEKDLDRLSTEAILLVSAGTMTTQWVITIGIYYLLSSPPNLQKLRIELAAAILDSSKAIPLAVLESLPYLKGVVLESLRLSYGVTNRLARKAHEPMHYTDKSSGQTWLIPAGIPCSSISLIIHSNPTIFPQPREFRPERWIENPRLDKYMVSFSRGTRQCVGMSLAYAEVYLMLAKVFREFGTKECRLDGDKGVLELFETDQRDVEPVGDYQIPTVWEGSKGVRMRVLNADA